MTERIIRINRFLAESGIYPQAAREAGAALRRFGRPHMLAWAARLWGVLVAVCAGAGALATVPAAGAEANLRMSLVTSQGVGAGIGIIRLADAKEGLHLTPLLRSLSPGVHAILLRPTDDCGPAEIGGHPIAAGASLATGDAAASPAPDPALPPLMVDKDGMARRALIAPGVKLEKLAGRALVIYAGDRPSTGDANAGAAYAIVACGVIQ